MSGDIFQGCIPALLTPCATNGQPDFDALVEKARWLIGRGMSAVVYCGSVGEWPLLSARQRQEGVARLVAAGLPVVVGTGAASPAEAAAHAAHARRVGAGGLMAIPRVLSRGSSQAAQRDHFAAILSAAGGLGAAGGLPTVIYNSPHYGFETRAELFFELRQRFPNLVGYKEFGGAQALTYAAEHITSVGEDAPEDGAGGQHNRQLRLLVGVDTEVVHGIVNCAADGWISGIGNVLPDESLALMRLSMLAAQGDPAASRWAMELAVAMHPLCELDTGADLVLFFRHLAVLRGDEAYARPLLASDALTPAQAGYATRQLRRFERWWEAWEGPRCGS